MKTANEYENKYWDINKLVIGIDEAGRGPLAGPLVVAGVVFPIGYDSKDIYDSKKLSEKKRNELYDVIVNDALYFDIRVVSPQEVDRLNIYQATRKAMTQIGNDAPVDVILTDAMKLIETEKEVIDLIKGDQKSASIAAGSILAKVTRDRIMYELDKIYPQYNFAENKGYPTPQHLQALEEFGITEIHRRSYKPVMETMQGKLF